MMTRRSLALSLLALSLLLPLAAQANEQQKPIKTLISAVRYGKDALALSLMDGDAQGKVLLAEDWEKGSAAQRTEFQKLFHSLFAAMAFPKIRADFQKLETVLYETPQMTGATADVGSTIVILHPLKKQEIKARHHLRKGDKGWKFVDVTVQGDKSMLTNIRNDQIIPIMKEGGWDHLLKLMRERAAELAKKK